jgi:DNA-binding response OmpR family regulator
MSDIDARVVTYSPILVVDADAAGAADLSRKLNSLGWSADIAISCTAAKAAAHARHYRSLVLVADPDRASDLGCLASLRSRLPSTWIIVIVVNSEQDGQNATLRHCADALLTKPFSMDDLVFRLSAFSHRPRPP